jgi:hypothetical protein
MPDPIGKGLNAAKLGSKGSQATDNNNDGAREAKIRKVLAVHPDATSKGSGLKESVRVSQGPKVFDKALNMAVGPVMHVDNDSDIEQPAQPAHVDVQPEGSTPVGSHAGQLTPEGAENDGLTVSSSTAHMKLTRSGTNQFAQVRCGSDSTGSVTPADGVTSEAQQLKVCWIICYIQSCDHQHAYCSCARPACY